MWFEEPPGYSIIYSLILVISCYCRGCRDIFQDFYILDGLSFETDHRLLSHAIWLVVWIMSCLKRNITYKYETRASTTCVATI